VKARNDDEAPPVRYAHGMRNIPLMSRVVEMAQANPPNPAVNAPPPLPRLRVTLPLRLLTPIIGGGVRPMEPDRAQPVRVTALRGALRWWWRVLQATPDVRELREHERLLFGGVARKGEAEDANVPSLVRVDVKVTQAPTLVPAGVHNPAKNGRTLRPAADWNIGGRLGYALFPLQLPKEELDTPNPKKTNEVIDSLEFDLNVELDREALRQRVQAHANAAVKAAKLPGRPPDALAKAETDALPAQVTKKAETLAASAIEALRWWLHWGGVGARTRRGFGAVALRDAKIAPVEVSGGEGLVNPEKLATLPTLPLLQAGQVRPSDRPTLFGACVLRNLYTTGLGDPKSPHGVLVYALWEMRQAPDYARDPGRDKQPGRTRWPEAELMKARLANGSYTLRHPQEVPARDRARLTAPRAAFGLPIVMHFKDHGDSQAAGQIIPAPQHGGQVKTDRWASPVLLRPQQLPTGQLAASVLILAGAAVPTKVEIVPTNPGAPVGQICDVNGSVGARHQLQRDLVAAKDYALLAFFNRLRVVHNFQHVDGAQPEPS
jgi:CRISPR-associated protein Cmr1